MERKSAAEKAAKIVQYKTMKDENGLPALHAIREYNYAEIEFNTPSKIAEMMNKVFQANRQTEEYFYEACFTVKMGLIGVFEISHGTIDRALAGTREVIQKALLCGAASIVLLHNHPSGSPQPSREDNTIKDRMVKAGQIIGITVVDNIIIGNGGRYFSYKEAGKME